MKRLEVRLEKQPGVEQLVGVLLEQGSQTHFEYDSVFLGSGLNLSPFRLPFKAGLWTHRDHSFGPLPGLFDDSLPDGWGLLLMERLFRRERINLADVSPLDRLAYLGTRTMGALTYHPPRDTPMVDRELFDLHELAKNATEILSGESCEVLPRLLRAGGSPGGARPKVLLGCRAGDDHLISGVDDLPEDFEAWLVKFIAPTDDREAGVIEYAYSLMAAAAGIIMPPTRLFVTPQGDRFFGVKRFDRKNNRRFHMHTFGNLIHANFRIPSCDYGDLFRVTSLLTRNHSEVQRAFRLMVFNVMAHNRDDHVKNFAFLLNDATTEWSLSPAYDLTNSAGPGGEHSMTVAGEGRNPSRDHMLRLANKHGLAATHLNSILKDVCEAVAAWPEFAKQAGVSKEAVERIGQQHLQL